MPIVVHVLGWFRSQDFNLGSYSSVATFTMTSSETSASFVSTPFLTIRASLLSLSDKSTGEVLGHVDVD